MQDHLSDHVAPRLRTDRTPAALRTVASLAVLSALLMTSISCSTAYYKTLEGFGIEKREILIDRVAEARKSQTKAKEQFEDALEEFQALVGYDGGNLEKAYDKVKREYDQSRERAATMESKVDAVESVAEDLFKEWQRELERYQDADLRRRSAEQLDRTRMRYADLQVAMRKPLTHVDPVLQELEDQVLFLKHNLNAEAVGSLGGTADELRVDVHQLIRDMEASIAEADRFLATMKK